MKKKSVFLFILLSLLLGVTACGRQAPPSENPEPARQTVELTVWGAEEDEALLQQLIASFQTHYANEADFLITCQPQSESNCKDVLLGDLEAGADVFTFADDQVAALAAAGALDPIADAAVIQGANLSAAVEAASVNGILYAYPLTADNGYFLYYNKAYFSEEDVQTMDRLLAVAADEAADVTLYFAVDPEVGLNEDGLTNYCTWNSTDGPVTGVDVARAMLDIAASPGFASRTDEEFLAGVQDGSVLAGVSGVWNAKAIQEAWGEHAGAVKLPTYTCGGQQIQMASFSGCKLVGVNAYSRYPEWAARLAEWITNEENQRLRFAQRGQGPANSAAAASPEVQQSAAIAALLAQSEFSQIQRVGGNLWDPVTEFATSMAQGNPSGASLQVQLDRMVEGVTAR